jgi:hypothetical protein
MSPTAGGEFRTPNGDVLRTEVDMIDVSSALDRPDKRWTYTDRAGHEHRYERRLDDSLDHYPTLVVVREESYWCPDCHEEHADSHKECPLCGEMITPGLVSAPLYREYTPGMQRFYLNDEEISPDRYRELVIELTGQDPRP